MSSAHLKLQNIRPFLRLTPLQEMRRLFMHSPGRSPDAKEIVGKSLPIQTVVICQAAAPSHWLAGEKVNKTHLLFTMFVQSVLSIAVARVPNALPVHRLTAATDAGLFRGDVVKATGSYDSRYDRFSMWTAAEALWEGPLIIVLIYNQWPDIFTRCKGIA